MTSEIQCLKFVGGSILCHPERTQRLIDGGFLDDRTNDQSAGVPHRCRLPAVAAEVLGLDVSDLLLERSNERAGSFQGCGCVAELEKWEINLLAKR